MVVVSAVYIVYVYVYVRRYTVSAKRFNNEQFNYIVAFCRKMCKILTSCDKAHDKPAAIRRGITFWLMLIYSDTVRKVVHT